MDDRAVLGMLGGADGSIMSDDECNVCVSAGDGEPAEFSTTMFVRARKPHTCVECHRLMPVGERHEVETGKWDGWMGTYRTCLSCQEIRQEFCCDGWTYGALWEHIEEDLFPIFTEACVAKLQTFTAKSLLAARWRQWKGLP